MRIFFFLLLSISIWGCSTVEVTKEVIKATGSVKTTIMKSFPEKKNGGVEEKPSEEVNIKIEKEVIEEKQKKEKSIVENQKKIAEINLIGDTEKKIISLIGNAQLSRIDGPVSTLRYDSDNCRLFLFFNQEIKNKRVEYFELRNTKGKLLDNKKLLEQCYREFGLIN
tara:strand:+ start:634 stop:1134 length:501 start_codon:yes stop_codon:yes gene_type:complete